MRPANIFLIMQLSNSRAGAASASCAANVLCMSIYAGIILGLFGGIIFLIRRQA